jgi:hypothetical protein
MLKPLLRMGFALLHQLTEALWVLFFELLYMRPPALLQPILQFLIRLRVGLF